MKTSGCRRDEPRTDLGLVFQILEMLDQLDANRLEHIVTIGRSETRLVRNREYQSAIPRDQGFPSRSLTFQTPANELRIAQFPVGVGFHFRIFLAFQKL